MKLYLDDVRKPPFGWDLVKTADECVAVLETGLVEELSLDHDLAPEHYGDSHEPVHDGRLYAIKTGLNVVDWMVEHKVWPKTVIVHSMNPAGRMNMLRTLRRYAPEGTSIVERVGWCRSTDDE